MLCVHSRQGSCKSEIKNQFLDNQAAKNKTSNWLFKSSRMEHILESLPQTPQFFTKLDVIES